METNDRRIVLAEVDYYPRDDTFSDEERSEYAKLADRWLKIPYCPWEPNPGPQERSLLDFGRESLYGGAVGGSKSVGLLMQASQFLNVPGYDALLLRKTFQDLGRPGALMDLANEWWAGQPGVKFERQEHRYRFDAHDHRGQFIGYSRIGFGGLDTENDRLKYQGGRFHFCCVGETPIYMADGSWKQIRDVVVGDLVATLEGPRTVTRTITAGVKPTYRVTNHLGHSITVGAGHRILTTDGWQAVDRLAQTSTRSHAADNTRGSSRAIRRGVQRQHAYSRLGSQPALALAGRTSHHDGAGLVTDAWSEGHRTGVAASCDARRGDLPPQESSVRAVLHGPALASTESLLLRSYRQTCGSRHEMNEYELPSLPIDCPSSVHSCGERLHPLSGVDLGNIQRLTDVAVGRARRDDRDSIPQCSPDHSVCYVHPYTKEERHSHQSVVLSSVCVVQAGEEECFDLTIETSSHYTTLGGLVSANCGYDELTQFKERDYTYLFSRQRRTTTGPTAFIPMRMRSTSNPGGPGHEWVFKRFIVMWDRWMNGLGPRPKRNFHPAMLKDNPHLDEADYVESLMELDPVTRAQLLRGDWNIRPDGRMFRRSWFKPVRRDEVPGSCTWVRYWDMAGTDAVPGLDPDYTVGCLVGRSSDGRFWIADVRRWRKDPGVSDDWCRRTAVHDTRRVIQAMEQEPGASGKVAIHHYRTGAFATTGLRAVPASGKSRGRTTTITAGRKTPPAKILAAGPVASHADAGLVHVVVDGTWEVDDFLSECEIFPDGDHDDQVDAFSGAVNLLVRLPVGALALGEAQQTLGQENPWRPDAVKNWNMGDDMEARIAGALLKQESERAVKDRVHSTFAV